MSKGARFEVYQEARSKAWRGMAKLHGYSVREYLKMIPWRWRLKGANGEIVAQGEAYGRKADCLRAVKAIRRLAAEARVVTGKPR